MDLRKQAGTDVAAMFEAAEKAVKERTEKNSNALNGAPDPVFEEVVFALLDEIGQNPLAKTQQHFVNRKTFYTHGPWNAAAADRGSTRADDSGGRQRRIDAPNPRSESAPRRLRGARREQRRGRRQAPR